MKRLWFLSAFLMMAFAACNKDESTEPALRYFKVGIDHETADWRDSAFVVATKDLRLLKLVEEQLQLQVAQRKMVTGALLPGNAGYNFNASHQFLWHFDEGNWSLADFSAEVYDGRPYTDVDQDTAYWNGNLGRFAPWSSYIEKEIKP